MKSSKLCCRALCYTLW